MAKAEHILILRKYVHEARTETVLFMEQFGPGVLPWRGD